VTRESARPALRIVSWNIENLAPALRTAEPAGAARGRKKKYVPELYDMAERLGFPDVLCLQEVRIRPADAALCAAMHSALPGYVCHAALSDDPVNVRFRGGRAHGVATYVREELGPHALPQPSWDREGRLVCVELPAHGLAIGNVYAVNGTDKPYFDHALGRVEGDRHAFKRRFQSELIQHFQPLREGRELVLIGDFNVSRTALDTFPRLRTELPHALARAMFNDTLMPALDVVDAFRELHPELRQYTWFNRLAAPGRLDAARVDFALVSRTLMTRIATAAIHDEPTLRFHSDHAPLEISVRVSA
jgi:exodeoxyribonuclease-3